MTTSDSRTTLQKNIGLFIRTYYDNKDDANKSIYEEFTKMIAELKMKTGDLKTFIQTLAEYVEKHTKFVAVVGGAVLLGGRKSKKSKKSKKYKKSKKSKKSRKSKKSKTRR